MATAAGDGAAPYENGGAGGKFRKRPFRRTQTTPYDRPPINFRNPNSGNNNSLFTKLVDPASKLIYAGAHRLFGVFRKRLPPPLPPHRPPETIQEPRNGLQKAIPNNCTGVPELSTDQDRKLDNISDATEISELEQMLKQKTFTRSEIDRLTALLHSRTVDLPAVDENKRDEANLPSTSKLFRHEASTSSPLNKNKDERDDFNAIVTTPVVSSRVLEDDVASPAELAKAYMGSRPSKVSPSVLGLRSQAPRQESSFLNHATILPRTPMMSVVPKTANSVRVPENGFTTPRSRGRSAIYSMARTPYSRVPSTVSQKGIKSDYGYGGQSSSLSTPQTALEQEGAFGSKQMALKRRSSVLDDDIGSVGPMRRIRQKPNLLSQGSYHSTRGREYGSSYAQHPVSSTQKLLLMNGPDQKASKAVEGKGDTSIRTSTYASVPTKSTQMATKILQHLERLSPNKKFSESKLLATREKSPTKLTPNMLHGQALRSLENVDSPKCLPSPQDSQKSEALHNNWLPDARDSTSQSKDKVEESGPRKFAVPRNMLTPMNGNATVSMNNGPNVKTADSTLKLPAEPPQKKRSFQMSAHEDSMEMDDDIHSNGLVSIPLAESKKHETSVVVSKTVSGEVLSEVAKTLALPEVAKTPTLPEVAQTALPEVAKISALPEVSKMLSLPEVAKSDHSAPHQRIDFVTFGGPVVNEEKIGFTLPTSSPPSTTSQSVVLTQSTSIVDKVAPPKESNAFPSFVISPQNVQKVSPFVFSTNEPSDLKSSAARADSKQESLTSLANVALVANNDQVKISVSDRGDNNKTQKSVDIVGKSEPLFSAVSTATSTTGIFSFGGSTKNTNLPNGTSSPSLFSSSAPFVASNNNNNQFFNNSLSHVTSSGSTEAKPSITTPAATSIGFSTSAAAPIFSFGSSLPVSTSVSTVSTTSGAETTDTKAKNDKEPTLSSISSSPFGGTSFTRPSTGSSLFGVSSSAITSTVNNQASLFSAGSGSLASTGSSFVGSSAPLVSGTSGITSSTSGSSIFGSSNPASASPFSSTPSFGLGSAVPSSEANSGSSTSGSTAPSIFGSNWQQPAKSSVFGSTFSSPSTGFSFGTSTSLTAASNSPIVFGSSNNTGAALTGSSMFSFTIAAATTPTFPSLSPTQSVFGNSTPVFTSTTPASNNDQMSMEDSMAEDPMQAPGFTPAAIPSFGQPPAPGFMFGSNPAPQAPTFQFGGQPNQAPSQNMSPFQASSSADFSAGGSFSLGSGGVEKSNRKIVRVSKSKNRRK